MQRWVKRPTHGGPLGYGSRPGGWSTQRNGRKGGKLRVKEPRAAEQRNHPELLC